uniref:MADF domain-containing protein n=2 Tax=Drosophila melanogaster TaxID=7227 RepID=Q8INU1_DROME|nr:uncharacterized protein Dmel_CG31627 [Drosophila melanogaster]AAN11100.2 uncharacterized protein Dmel_CG31627 [Drosophila melanogaster]|eukprot:NP_724314.2 uncharacterized protein Dmel_CG31627 [Drosophila melanogaster]
MKRRAQSKTSVASSTDFFSLSDKPSLGRRRALLAAKLKRQEQSTTSFDSSTGSYTYTDATSLRKTPITFSPSPEFMKTAKAKLKLIALYEDHKCLWNQRNKDFFNFELKDRIWDAIADEMKADSPSGFWKHMIHKLRYKVEMERIQEQGAKFSGESPQPKLFYSDNLLFLNHMFDREGGKPPREIPMHLKPSGPTLEKNPSRNLRHVQEKRKRTPIREKMASLEKLRNLQNSKFVLSRDAFQKIQKITSGGPYYLTKTKIRP